MQDVIFNEIVALPEATPSRFGFRSSLLRPRSAQTRSSPKRAPGSATHHHIIPTFSVKIPNDIFGFHVFPPLAFKNALLFNFVNGISVQ